MSPAKICLESSNINTNFKNKNGSDYNKMMMKYLFVKQQIATL